MATLGYIVLIWLVLAGFNVWKIFQSNNCFSVLETLIAIMFSPLYFIVAFVVVFILKKW